MRHFSFLLMMALCALTALSQKPINPGSTRAATTALLSTHTPALQYDPSMPADSFGLWQERMSEAMRRLMVHPEAPAAPQQLVSRVSRPGYTVERWCAWPLAEGPVHYLVLIPDSVEFPGKRPAALCIPGFGQTKELLAGERGGNYSLEGDAQENPSANAMALQYVRQGIVAVAVDNPSFGELSDNGYSDFLASSRMLLETGWSYLGLTSWQDKVILDAMKQHPAVDTDRIIVSGFSLGTEPLMVLGLIDPSIKAFVYNDFLCRTRERILVMDRQAADGSRSLPNSIEHLIPGFLMQFDFPDIVAALAPRPVICTEGGLDRDFRIVAHAFAKAGAPDAFSYHHYPKYADPASRELINSDTVPSGIDRDTFFRLANVDPPSHGFKASLVLPWVNSIVY